MSGMEIAGLVLAVIPLFVAAAEHLQSNKSTKKAIRTGIFAGSYKGKLTHQQTLLDLYLKGIVERTSLSAKIKGDLIHEPGGELWKDPDVKKALYQELGDAYQSFVELLHRVCTALALCVDDPTQTNTSPEDVIKLLENLSLDAQQATKSDDDHISSWKRIKLKFKSSSSKALLEEIEECNLLLERLSRAAFHAKPYEKTQRARRAHMTFQQHEEAERLFHILRKACKCQNSAIEREIALRLRVPDHNDDSVLESRFQMLLFDSQRALCELSARVTRAEAPGPLRKKARIAFAPRETSITQESHEKNMKMLDEICDEARLAAANNSGLYLYVDKKEDVYTQQDTLPTSGQNPPLELLSLTSMMTRLQVYEKKTWVHREKSILAITLAYSLLSLHNSPWLQVEWNSDSISFIDEHSGHISERTQLRRPFTRSKVSATASCSPSSASTSLRRNAHLHALGIMLLELYLNRSLEPDFQKQIQQTGSVDCRGVAIDVLEDCSDELAMTSMFNSATRFCLSPYPNPLTRSFSFDDRGFREIFYTEVIVNLEENLRSRFEMEKDYFL